MDASISASTSPALEAHAFEHLPRAALVIDRNGAVIAANAACREIAATCTADPDCRLETISDFLVGPRPRLLGDIFAAASSGQAYFRLREAGHDTGRRRISFRVTRLASDGQRVTQLLLFQVDLPQVSRAFAKLNFELRRANIAAAAERERNEELREHVAALERFSYATAHDLKSPLRSISILLELLEIDHGADLPKDAHDLVSASRDAARRLQALVDDLLEHARSSTGRINVRSVDIGEALNSVRTDLSAVIEQAGAEIVVAGDLGEVTADPTLLERLLENLIGNALKYRSSERSLVVTVSRMTCAGAKEALLVTDNGIGFDNAYREQLFQPFRRLHAADEIEGTGIGLATCKTICDRHGWSLDAEGRPGEGATFRVLGLS